MKKLAAALAAVLALSLPASAQYAPASFPDVAAGAWYYEPVMEMAASGVIEGFEDGSFRPEQGVTVAEAVTMAARMTSAPTGADSAHWAGVQLSHAEENGWLPADASPDAPATRELMCRVTAAAFGLSAPEGSALPFPDSSEISPDCAAGVLALTSSGVVEGFEDGTFRPRAGLTRAQAAAILSRASSPGGTQPEGGALITAEGCTAEEIIDYFCDVALGSEYGDARENVVRWSGPIRYHIAGSPTEEDLELFTALAAALNGVEGFPGISAAEDEDGANLTVNFVSQSEMDDILGEGYNGYVTVWWHGDHDIYEGEIYYSTDISQKLRRAVIVEELCQGLGLLTDTYDHPESIFYQYHLTTDWPTELDWAVIRLLYSAAISPGMDGDGVRAAAASVVG